MKKNNSLGFGSLKWDGKIDFVDKDTNNSGVEETADKLLKLYKEKVFHVVSQIIEIGLPKPNEQLRLITKRSFNAISLIQHIIDIEGVIENAAFCIYSINHEASLIINDYVNSGKIKECTILMSNLRNVAYRKKEEAVKNYFADNPNIKLIFASSHSKIITMQTAKGNYYTIEGSGNLSFNSRIEQYVIDNDKALFDFTFQWMDEICAFLYGKKELVIYDKIKDAV